MTKYAENTEVPTEKSVAEIQATLKRYGAAKFAFFTEEERLTVGFEMRKRMVRFVVPLPPLRDFLYDGRNSKRSAVQQLAAKDRAERQRYRALLLVIKAKLEAVESEIETFDEAFLAQLVLPSGQTAGDWLVPQVEHVYQTGVMPSLLALPSGRE